MGQLNRSYFLLHSYLNAYQKLLKEVGKCSNCARFLNVGIIASPNPICRQTQTLSSLCVISCPLKFTYITDIDIYTHKHTHMYFIILGFQLSL